MTSCPFCHSLASDTRRSPDGPRKTQTYHCMLCNKTWRDGPSDKVRPTSSAIVRATRSAPRNARGVKRPT